MPRLNTATLATAFKVTPMTIYLWRKGTATRTELPTVKPKKGESAAAVIFDSAAVIKWANRHAIDIPNKKALLTAADQPATKTGPKPKVKPTT